MDLSEIYLDSTFLDSLFEIDGYNLVHADHLNNIKRGGVCIHYKETLPVQVISFPYFKEALLLETTDNNIKIIASLIYRSTSQNNSEFDSFLSNLEQLLREINKCKQTVSVITGDFNARSWSLWAEDINRNKIICAYILKQVFAIN